MRSNFKGLNVSDKQHSGVRVIADSTRCAVRDGVIEAVPFDTDEVIKSLDMWESSKRANERELHGVHVALNSLFHQKWTAPVECYARAVFLLGHEDDDDCRDVVYGQIDRFNRRHNTEMTINDYITATQTIAVEQGATTEAFALMYRFIKLSYEDRAYGLWELPSKRRKKGTR